MEIQQFLKLSWTEVNHYKNPMGLQQFFELSWTEDNHYKIQRL